jgi:hypothetical protein
MAASPRILASAGNVSEMMQNFNASNSCTYIGFGTQDHTLANFNSS